MRDENRVYDRLAMSATGDQLTQIYLQNRQSLEFENRGGARATLDEVDILAIVSRNPSTPLIASHPIYDYFARRYGLNLVSVHWEPDQVPHNDQLREFEKILKRHSAEWMIWEGQPVQASVAQLKALGVDSLVFDPCGNVPDQGDFMTVMRRNVEDFRRAFPIAD